MRHALQLPSEAYPLLPLTTPPCHATPSPAPWTRFAVLKLPSVIRSRGVLRRLLLTLLVVVVSTFAWRVIMFLHLYQDPGVDDIFDAVPFVPRPYTVEPLVTPFYTLSSPSSPSPTIIQAELDTRLSSTSLNFTAPSTLSCPVIPSFRYSHLLQNTQARRTLIAINLFNSQLVIPTLFRTIISLASFLPPSSLHVSIFENGSEDGTHLAMAHLAAALTALGVPHDITSDPRTTDWAHVDRIEQLAVFRNVVLDQAIHGRVEGRDMQEFSTVVFINDVFACPSDVLELMHQRIAQDAHAACGLDWVAKKPIIPLPFLKGSGGATVRPQLFSHLHFMSNIIAWGAVLR